MTQETTPQNGAAVTPETQQAQSAEKTTAKTYTDTEVQEMIKDRLARQSGSERKKLLEEIGIEDVATDTEILKSAKAKREADKSETQKALDAKIAAETERDTLKAQVEDLRLTRLADQRDDALKTALATLKIKPERVKTMLSLLKNDEDTAESLLALIDGDSGTALEPTDKRLVKIADDAKKAYPEFFSVGGVGSPPQGGGRIHTPDPGSEGTGKHYNRL